MYEQYWVLNKNHYSFKATSPYFPNFQFQTPQDSYRKKELLARKALGPRFRLLLSILAMEMGNHSVITQERRRHLFRKISPTPIVPRSKREEFLETNSLIQTSREVCKNYPNVPKDTLVSSGNHLPNKVPISLFKNSFFQEGL